MFTLPKLPYKYDALEPHIDKKTMEIHHDKHHQAYVDNLNKAFEGRGEWLNLDVKEVLKKIKGVPEDIRQAVINNGGGHANHTFFWELLTPGGSMEPTGDLKVKIDESFGSFDAFKAKFSEVAMKRFGSGWAWLVDNGGTLEVYSTANQDSPLMEGKKPIVGLDVWEHAYYLKYQNRRAEYVQAFWGVINWDKANEEFDN